MAAGLAVPGPRLEGVDWVQTTRHGGVSEAPYGGLNLAPHVGEPPGDTAANWRVLGRALGFGRAELATCRQVHGDGILAVVSGGHHAADADALVSTTPGVGVGVYTADCVPVLYAVPGLGVAAAHCGWRGAAAGLAGATLRVLAKAADVTPAAVHVYLAAGIAGRSYDVGAELLAHFEPTMLRARGGGKYELDVAAAVVADLLKAGASHERLHRSGVDTYADVDYYSYRRDGQRTGRMLSFVRLQ